MLRIEPSLCEGGPVYVTLDQPGAHVVVAFPSDAVVRVSQSARGAKKAPDGSWYSPLNEYSFYFERLQ
jgi:hypothetical protein